MARAQLNTAVSDLEAVVKTMRKLGVASWANSPIGDVILGMEPASRAAKTDPDPKADRRNYYSEILGRPVTDGELDKLP
jgi:hypothetical protein